MRTVMPPDSGTPMRRSVTVAIASILEIESQEVPVPDETHPEPWTVWGQWLAQRGLGLVQINDPPSFDWPGPWLAMLSAGENDLVGAIAFGSPPGLAWKPLDGPETFSDVRAGYVIAPADVALWQPVDSPEPRRTGHIEAIAIASGAEQPMVRIDNALARAGRGLEGDRYFDQRGTFSNVHGRGYDLTLIEAEVLDALALPAVQLAPEEARRNLITRGIDLNALVGKTFTIGGVQCQGQRLCEPCAHLERLTAKDEKPGTLRALVHKGGLRADVLSDGEIRVGDTIVAT